MCYRTALSVLLIALCGQGTIVHLLSTGLWFRLSWWILWTVFYPVALETSSVIGKFLYEH